MSRSLNFFHRSPNSQINGKARSVNMRLLLLTLGSLTSSLAIAAPIANANRLETFVYDLTDSKIEFSLKDDIEPKGTVISNPTRIVIDLPGIVYQGPTVRRRVGRGVQAVRVGQVDANTTRMVVEFSPYVTINPQQLKLKSRQPGKWSMQLPQNIAAIDLNSVSSFVLPITGAVISSGFGWRVHPVTGEKRMHKGVDFAAPTGTPIFAAADGVVTEAGWTNGGYGNIVELRHSDGSVTLYAHTSRVYVSKGQVVNRGQAIAEVGTTGRSTGPHLHFEVQPDGKNAVDPMDYLQMSQVTLDLASNSFKD
ncbi:MAG: M23 family metallopeptidase [Pseudanabaena sp. M090S1SP1A06QC]|uniref:peptidoglycan DD-metalloendopeptidase family protein n=1 Tax=Pseudanabaena mucicola TaxID=71190 RepID=UPI002577E799|nr:M23 family metallopeptidase [Pseudanabaena mucicola]MCA6575518.1 M23 family metallopeptidase [Pseudanabaena sp. M53BS1SP1A06MG]MCA6580894.1 M23 family metallopeptidase [Pseudanabaena sp. M34BS1SP1A06MG]MCA6589966.1 M23 family metallopeptidase [Pseudanabaena sp. M109S1SP1A06QC]MCA6594212.1 M23 family metallopeptidase [Pseudanabaena sp. M38BS1SP1A06MG]MCA6599087.1 M23 family metallopeptidase [Pseudanabaena sp. M57BS1SP1A06MG]MCA6605384.1 M23 family metallopeptidase [Pseudanabaena sp. M007S1S